MTKLILILAAQIFLLAAGDKGDFARTTKGKHIGLNKGERLTHFRVYWHDYAGGRNASAVMIKQPVRNSKTTFGAITMFDDALTLDVARNSTVVGQGQGFYAGASQTEFGLLHGMYFVFTAGEYNGSTIVILGRNMVLDKVREMPVIGGSGIFRFARGYVEARTMLFNITTGESNVEFNCYVLHY